LDISAEKELDVTVPETVFEKHLFSSALRYFPDLAGSDITVLFTSKQKHSNSTFYRFQVGNTSTHYPIIIKVRDSAQSTQAEFQQDTLDSDSLPLYQLEYRGLKSIYSHFSHLNDPRFGAVRPLDLLDNLQAIIMTESQGQDMRWVFLRQNRLSRLRNPDSLDAVFRNAGGWLRAFHRIPQADYVTKKYASFDDYKSYIEHRSYFEHVTAFIDSQILPKPLPLARGHNDFSMRNILIDPNNRITVIDSIAKWQAVIYEDIGYFLNGLYTNQAQVLTQQLAFSPQWIARCEQNFLEGYFTTEAIPHRVISLYKLTALLDKWASLAEYIVIHNAPKEKILVKKYLRRKLSNRTFRKIADELMK
jgi:hypothetical protein